MFGRWGRYVPASQRRRRAELEQDRLAKSGQSASPVILTGRTIARTPWGTAWCANIERFSDYGNRLPRGRTYVRNGSVIDLQITPGQVVHDHEHDVGRWLAHEFGLSLVIWTQIYISKACGEI